MCYKVLLTLRYRYAVHPCRYAPCLNARWSNFCSCPMKEVGRQGVLFFCFVLGYIQLKTCEKTARSPASTYVCTTIILWRHLTNLSNTVAKNAPKFSKVCSSRTKTKVLQSISNNSSTVVSQCRRWWVSSHTSLRQPSLSRGNKHSPRRA